MSEAMSDTPYPQADTKPANRLYQYAGCILFLRLAKLTVIYITVAAAAFFGLQFVLHPELPLGPRLGALLVTDGTVISPPLAIFVGVMVLLLLGASLRRSPSIVALICSAILTGLFIWGAIATYQSIHLRPATLTDLEWTVAVVLGWIEIVAAALTALAGVGTVIRQLIPEKHV